MNNKRRVMLLGGSGFIGSHLARCFLDRGVQPVVVDWVRSAVVGVEYHAAELRTLADLSPALVESVDAIYFLAWTTKPQSANQSPDYDLESNVLAGLHFLNGLLQFKKHPKIIFVSTGGAIYGAPQNQPTPETECPNPIGAYGISKLFFEHYLALYHRQHGLDYLILRPGNPYGEGQSPEANQGAIGVFLGQIAKNKHLHIWGDGSVIRDYIYIDDLVEGMASALEFKPTADSGRVFNLASGKGVSLNHLIMIMEAITGSKPLVHYEPGRVVDVPEIVLDCSRARSFLGWHPSTTLEDGISRTWKWIKTTWAHQ